MAKKSLLETRMMKKAMREEREKLAERLQKQYLRKFKKTPSETNK